MNGYNLVRHQKEQDTAINARVKKTGDNMSGNLIMTNNAKLIGDVQGNATTATKVSNSLILNIGGFPASFNGQSRVEVHVAPNVHSHGSDIINQMAGYVKGNTSSAITTSDTLNSAIGKLENKIDSKANLNHTHNYLPLTGGTLTGDLKIAKSNAQITLNGKDTNYYQIAHSSANGTLVFSYNGKSLFTVQNSGSVIPVTNKSISIGSDAYRLHSIYSGDGSFDGELSTKELKVLGYHMSIGEKGNGSAWLGFYDTVKRKGFVGKESSDSDDIFIKSESVNGSIRLESASNSIYAKGHLMPREDNSHYLGNTSYRWKQLVAVSPTISTSDITFKENIMPIVDDYKISTLTNSKNDDAKNRATKQDYYNFVKDRFKPYSYDYKVDEDVFNAEKNKSKSNELKNDSIKENKVFSIEDKMKMAKSIGFIANEYDIENDIVAKDFIFKTEDGLYSYNTGNFATITMIALQKAIEKIELLENKVDTLII